MTSVHRCGIESRREDYLPVHEAQLLTYLRLDRQCESALLINFNVPLLTQRHPPKSSLNSILRVSLCLCVSVVK